MCLHGHVIRITGNAASLGYRFPAEWAPHRATWLAWPHNLDTWPGKFEPVPAIFRQFVETVASTRPWKSWPPER